MTLALTTALITSVTALLVALLQSISRRREAREIEELKNKLNRERELSSASLKLYIEYVVNGHTKELDTFKEYLRTIQVLREWCKSARDYPDQLEPHVFATEIEEKVASLVDCFAQHQTDFSNENLKPAHRLKNECSKMVANFCKHLRSLPQGSSVSMPSEIIEHEQKIAELQADLRKRAARAASRFADSLRKESIESAGRSRI